uniref:DNA2/NAM7 helicase-like C-terminal domain-containing protein n=1 Tax=Timspurckia oligopyrenoides TaxID=708627 RepID=A0A7S0ZDW8_9RHOD|mmetsp:Transcript_1492/g.2686  ORF Transcript_1492/g.2686 Transcript_1492/m.2686 type:complete len:1338 (+) Transcript_1492:39-4052(+)
MESRCGGMGEVGGGASCRQDGSGDGGVSQSKLDLMARLMKKDTTGLMRQLEKDRDEEQCLWLKEQPARKTDDNELEVEAEMSQANDASIVAQSTEWTDVVTQKHKKSASTPNKEKQKKSTQTGLRQSVASSETLFLDRALRMHSQFQMNTESDATKFLQAIIACSDGIELLLKLTSPVNAQTADALLRCAVSMSSSGEFLSKNVLPLLERLGADDCGRGSCADALDHVLHVIYSRELDSRLIKALRENSIGDDVSPLVWFLMKIGVRREDARENRETRKLVKVLKEKKVVNWAGLYGMYFGLDGFRKESDQDMSLDKIRDVPGGRHKNDKVDFRSIQIAPCLEEIVPETREPYLPVGFSVVEVDKNKQEHEGSVEQSAFYELAVLDRQFRLLREDMLGPMRAALKDLKASDELISDGPVPVYTNVQIETIGVKPVPHVMISVRLPEWHCVNQKFSWKQQKAMKKKKKNKTQSSNASPSTPVNKLEEFWESKEGSRTLGRDSLVLLLVGGKPALFATIVRRDVKDFVEHSCPMVGLSFWGNDFASVQPAQVVSEFLLEMYSRTQWNASVVEACANFFAYSPILKGLQRMESIPLARELVLGKNSIPPEYIASVDIEKQIELMQQNDVKSGALPEGITEYDCFQKDAMRLALSNRVSLTQGCPGTGKTFLGVRLVDVVLRCTTERILVLTYTNHALDDFLSGLIEQGITSIVRIGGNCSELLKEYQLEEQMKSSGLSSMNRRVMKEIRNSKQILESELERIQQELQEHDLREWEFAKKFFDQHQRRYIQCFNIGMKDDDGYVAVADNKHMRLEDDYLWKQWLRGNNRGHFEDTHDSGGPTASRSKFIAEVWSLDRAARLKLVEAWSKIARGDELQSCVDKMTEYESLLKQEYAIRNESKLSVLQSARVIGCTTTRAAMRHELLSDVETGVVIVEEAGEVLESHVIVNLRKNTKHLIMIGDHLQLRPKIANYELSYSNVDAKQVLNVSLFERLVKQGMTHGVLSVQHRMKPCIASFIQMLTYPELKNGPGTLDRASTRGVQSDVVFVNHNHREDGKTSFMEDATTGHDAHTRTNAFEVETVVNIVQYLLKQEYLPDQIVVLTPYLGQMFAIQSAMESQGMKPFASEFDKEDLRRAGWETSDDEEDDDEEDTVKVRVATVDNFQGEEADIVVISLVRCNNNGSIGFLREPERVNVMLSRARNCEIIVGSGDTFCNAKSSEGRKLWNDILGKLTSEGCVYDGFPVSCLVHNAKKQVKCTQEFRAYCPEGGCDRLCEAVLECGHQCGLYCHSYNSLHQDMKCEELIKVERTNGHQVEVKCVDVGGKVQCTRCQRGRESATESQ